MQECITITHMTHKEWIDELIKGDSYRQAAEKLEISGSTLTRQINAGKLSPEMVINLCRIYGRLPSDGLLETGYLEYGDIEGAGVPQALRWATNRQLLAEINRRSEPEATRLFGKTAGIINPIPPQDAQVFEFPKSHVAPLSDDEIADAIREANELQGAAQQRTEELTEPEST